MAKGRLPRKSRVMPSGFPLHGSCLSGASSIA